MPATKKKLTVEDVEALIGIARDSWKLAYRDIYGNEFIESWIREKYSKDKLLNEIMRSQYDLDIILLGSLVESTMTGFIELKINANKAELLRIYLKPEYTHKGIGKSLLLEAEKIMKKKDIVECSLHVHKQNGVAVSFYKKNGFKVKDVDWDDFVMEKKYKP
ncbi:MAG: GNAT family N-acetyltransferase [Candidatus Parvarchaeota archaeon]